MLPVRLLSPDGVTAGVRRSFIGVVTQPLAFHWSYMRTIGGTPPELAPNTNGIREHLIGSLIPLVYWSDVACVRLCRSQKM